MEEAKLKDEKDKISETKKERANAETGQPPDLLKMKGQPQSPPATTRPTTPPPNNPETVM